MPHKSLTRNLYFPCERAPFLPFNFFCSIYRLNATDTMTLAFISLEST